MISRVCEEFHLSPLAALEAINEDVGGLLFKIIDLRSYKSSFEAYQQGQREPELSQRPQGPGIDRVRDMIFELARERIEQNKSND